jgi:oligopeptide transport system ATP-binding protein
MRIHPVAKGEILYEGERITGRIGAAAERRLRQKVQMIFQDPMASLNERAKIDYIVSEGLYNFRLFKDEAERRAKVERALRDVGLLPEFASRFPHEFSGGQRQRIGIARAVVRNSPILILDEPTAALDTESEKVVMEAIERLMEGRTVIAIAHRLSTIRDSDKIVVLKGGFVAEEGTHDELIKRNQIYAELYRIQAGSTPAA